MTRFWIFVALVQLLIFAWPAAASSGKLQTIVLSPVVSIAANATWTSRCQAITAPPWVVFLATSGSAKLKVLRYLDTACTIPAGVASAAVAPLPLVQSAACPAIGYCGDAGGEMPTFAVKAQVTDTSGALNRVLSTLLIHDPPGAETRPVSSCSETRYC